MKLNTVMPYPQKAVRVSFTSIQDATGEIIREYFDDGDIEIRFIAQANKNATVYAKEDLPLFSMLRSIRDKGGLEVGGLYMVKNKTPVLNVLGFADGYAYTLVLQDGS
jgi:hypothetical protein